MNGISVPVIGAVMLARFFNQGRWWLQLPITEESFLRNGRCSAAGNKKPDDVWHT